MQVTSTQLNTKAKRVDAVKLSRYLINSKGFTLIELLTSIAIIGILAAVGIQQYTQFKVRGYDAHSKQGLRDMSFTCKAYWTENDISDECDLAKAKEYGFVQNTDVVATLPPSTLDSFCASAKHNSSPNTYYMDSVGTINSEENCSKAVSVATLVPKSGSCPSGWTVPVEELSGGRSRPLNYCVAESGALPIVPKTGACPSGWIVPVEELSGGRSRPLNYCMAEDTDTPSIVPKSGSCPSGWKALAEELSGGRSRPLNYCVEDDG